MSDNAMTTDTIKDLVRARYGGYRRPRGLLMLRAVNDILLRKCGGPRSERQGAGYRLFR